MGDQQWNSLTFIFYFFMIINCAALSKGLSGIKWKGGRQFNSKKADIAVPFIILILMKGFSLCGRDAVQGYKLNFQSAVSISEFRDKSLEFGYRLINLLVRSITENYTVFLMVIAVMTVIPVWYVISKHRDQIDVPMAIMAYTALFFFQGLSLLRIYLAASICFLSFDALFEKKYVKAIIWVFVACLFHITAIVMIIPCLYCVFHVNRKLFAWTLVSANVVLFVGREYLNSLFTGRYHVYSVSESFDFGTEFIWFYGPLVVLYYFRGVF